jgi:hypothetical protein
MRSFIGAAVLMAMSLAMSACNGGHRSADGSPNTTNHATRLVSDSDHLSRPLRRIAVEARRLTTSLGDSSVKTAEVYGPGSRLALVQASSKAWEHTTAAERNGFYLIIVRGHFVCRLCSVPSGAGPPRGTIATDIWTQSKGGTDFGLSGSLPSTMSRLGSPTVIRLR